jgi:hypothetical protein
MDMRIRKQTIALIIAISLLQISSIAFAAKSPANEGGLPVSEEVPQKILHGTDHGEKSIRFLNDKSVRPVFYQDYVAYYDALHLKNNPSSYVSGRSDLMALNAMAPDVNQVKPSSSDDVTPEREGEGGDIYGRRGGYLHPFLSISAFYTDNVFNSDDNKEDDTIIIISPGVWLSVPRVKERALNISTSTITPGGSSLGVRARRFPRHYQTYLLYRADIEILSRHSSENTVSHTIEGLLQLNLRGGLSIDIIDQYVNSHDVRGTGISTELDEYHANLFGVALTYDISPKVGTRIDYANFRVDYISSRNDFRDRTDNAVSGSIYYRVKPKTTTFLQYRFIDINYDEDIVSDSEEHLFYGGLMWDITEKSEGRVYAGYGVKEFSESDAGTVDNFIIGAGINHRFTPKTTVQIDASRGFSETNISSSDYVISHNLRIDYIQRLSARTSGSLLFAYSNYQYERDLTFGGEIKEREDNLYRFGIAFRYTFRKWLYGDTGYYYTVRDSNFSGFDYRSNTFFIRLTGAL